MPLLFALVVIIFAPHVYGDEESEQRNTNLNRQLQTRDREEYIKGCADIFRSRYVPAQDRQLLFRACMEKNTR